MKLTRVVCVLLAVTAATEAGLLVFQARVHRSQLATVYSTYGQLLANLRGSLADGRTDVVQKLLLFEMDAANKNADDLRRTGRETR